MKMDVHKISMQQWFVILATFISYHFLMGKQLMLITTSSTKDKATRQWLCFAQNNNTVSTMKNQFCYTLYNNRVNNVISVIIQLCNCGGLSVCRKSIIVTCYRCPPQRRPPILQLPVFYDSFFKDGNYMLLGHI